MHGQRSPQRACAVASLITAGMSVPGVAEHEGASLADSWVEMSGVSTCKKWPKVQLPPSSGEGHGHYLSAQSYGKRWDLSLNCRPTVTNCMSGISDQIDRTAVFIHAVSDQPTAEHEVHDELSSCQAKSAPEELMPDCALAHLIRDPGRPMAPKSQSARAADYDRHRYH